MGWFGRPTLSEAEAALQFVDHVIRTADHEWASITAEANEFTEEAAPLIADSHDPFFEFVLAVVFVHIQALPNLFKAKQAERIRWHIIKILSISTSTDHVRGVLDRYQRAWDMSIEGREVPLDALGSIFIDYVYFARSEAKQVGSSPDMPIFFPLFWAEKIVRLKIRPWKNVSEKFRLVP